MTSITPSPEMVERAMKPISMGDVRLAAGEGQLSAHDVLAAVNGILASRRRSLTAALSCPDGFRLVPVEALNAARMMSNMCFNLKQRGEIDERFRTLMAECQEQFDRAMLAASPAPAVDNAGWRPIETARKDDLRFTSATMLLAHSEKKWIRFGQFYVQEGVWYYSGTNERSQSGHRLLCHAPRKRFKTSRC